MVVTGRGPGSCLGPVAGPVTRSTSGPGPRTEQDPLTGSTEGTFDTGPRPPTIAHGPWVEGRRRPLGGCGHVRGTVVDRPEVLLFPRTLSLEESRGGRGRKG